MKDVLNFDKVADICTCVDRQWFCMLFLLASERDRRGTLSSSSSRLHNMTSTFCVIIFFVPFFWLVG